MKVEEFAQDIVVGSLMKAILERWLPVALPRREAMLARKAGRPHMPRRWSFS